MDLGQSSGSPLTRAWRITTAVRVFVLALVVGRLLGSGQMGDVVVTVAAIGVIVAVACVVELDRIEPRLRWVPVIESVLIAALLVGDDTSRLEPLLVYLAVPPVVAGVRHGWVTATNTCLSSTIAFISMGFASERVSSYANLDGALFWLIVGLGSGLLAGWQSRNIHELEERQAPYASAHHLMSQLHDLATRGAVGLDSVVVAAQLEAALRMSTGATSSAIFVPDDDGRHRLLASAGPEAEFAAQQDPSDDDSVPGMVVVPLRGTTGPSGHVVLYRSDGWSDELELRALTIADEYALRLNTAVLFDDVRLMATAEERNRIAREMHDGVAQEIVALGYVVDEIESVSDDHHTRALAASLRKEITRVVSELRFSIFDLRHHVSEHRLSGALAEYVREVSVGTDLRVHLLLDESGPALSPRTEMELLRVAQEAVGNVRRHAAATNVWVTLVSDGSCVRLEVEDDGVGNARPKERHWGLQTMQERASSIGATLTVSTRPGGGTAVRLHTRNAASLEGKLHHEHHSPAR